MTKSQSNLSQFRDFLSHLVTVKGDLSNVAAPPFVLAPRSVTEIPASWAEHHDLFLQAAHEDDPARRALLVLKNFLCSLKRQVYTTAPPNSNLEGVAKKPLNAFLGELFIGEFLGADGSPTRLISEQVSHHPPVTACFLYNKAHGISSSGYVAQKTTFSPTSGVRVQQIGHAIIRDEIHRESHLRTLPTMSIRGFLTGRYYPELEGNCYIASSSGYLTTIDFDSKKTSGYLGYGTRNSVHAKMTDIRNGGKQLFEITGQWDGRLTIKDSVNGTVTEEFDVDEIAINELKVKPIEKQSPWESRRAWAKVIEGIKTGDMSLINTEKNNLEEAQRQLRMAEKMVGAEWPRVFFQRATDSQEFALLAKAIPDASVRNLNQTKTAGVWRFIGISPAEALISEGVYHKALEPTGQVVPR
ncbi:Oxysterol-binding protein [Xylariaceae sp. FL1651]|nr:Oxysterol-binding protein [Xylariaceae sp. FL1651]